MDKIIVGEKGNIINYSNVFEISLVQPPYSEGENHTLLVVYPSSKISVNENVPGYTALYEGHKKNANEVKEYLLDKLIKKCFLIDLRECINQLPNREWKGQKPERKDEDIPF